MVIACYRFGLSVAELATGSAARWPPGEVVRTRLIAAAAGYDSAVKVTTLTKFVPLPCAVYRCWASLARAVGIVCPAGRVVERTRDPCFAKVASVGGYADKARSAGVDIPVLGNMAGGGGAGSGRLGPRERGRFEFTKAVRLLRGGGSDQSVRYDASKATPKQSMTDLIVSTCCCLCFMCGCDFGMATSMSPWSRVRFMGVVGTAITFACCVGCSMRLGATALRRFVCCWSDRRLQRTRLLSRHLRAEPLAYASRRRTLTGAGRAALRRRHRMTGQHASYRAAPSWCSCSSCRCCLPRLASST